jgi:hypothetical protein
MMLGIGAIFIGGFVPMLSHSMLALSLESLLAVLMGFSVWWFVWPKGH